MGLRWRKGSLGQVRQFKNIMKSRIESLDQVTYVPTHSLPPFFDNDNNDDDVYDDVEEYVVHQVFVLLAYSLLSYLSLSAHNAWMSENTVS